MIQRYRVLDGGRRGLFLTCEPSSWQSLVPSGPDATLQRLLDRGRYLLCFSTCFLPPLSFVWSSWGQRPALYAVVENGDGQSHSYRSAGPTTSVLSCYTNNHGSQHRVYFFHLGWLLGPVRPFADAAAGGVCHTHPSTVDGADLPSPHESEHLQMPSKSAD